MATILPVAVGRSKGTLGRCLVSLGRSLSAPLVLLFQESFERVTEVESTGMQLLCSKGCVCVNGWRLAFWTRI